MTPVVEIIGSAGDERNPIKDFGSFPDPCARP